MSKQTRRWPLIIAGILIAALITAFAVFQFGIRVLKSQVKQASTAESPRALAIRWGNCSANREMLLTP